MHSLDHRNDPSLLEFQARLDHLESEKRTADLAVSSARGELTDAQTQLEETQVRELIDSDLSKEVATLRKRVEAVEKRLARAEAAAARYPHRAEPC